MGSSLIFINGSTVGVALPALQSDLGSSVVGIQWITNAYNLLLAALLLLGGSLGDHFGRKRVFMIGVAVFGLASVWCGLAPAVGPLILARGVQGVGGALLTPGSLAIISATFAQSERGRAIGLWSGFSALTAAAGPLLGGWLIDTLSWRWIFWMLLPFAILALLIAWWRVPESVDEKMQDGLDWWGALLATLSLGGLTYGLIESSARGFGDPFVIGALVAGAVLMGLFIWVEARQPEPMVPLTLFRSSTFSGANGLTFLLYAALGGALFFLPLNLIQVQGYSATAAGAAFLPMILLLSLLSSWAGGLVATVGARPPLIVGPLGAALGFFLLARPGIGGSYWTTFFPALVVLGLGMAVSVAPLTTTVMNSVADHYVGTASGINNAVSRVASLMAIAALGIVMLGVFNSMLTDQITPLQLSPAVQQQLDAERADLAAAHVPASLDESTAHQIQQAIDHSFLVGYRVVMYIAAAMAVASAVIAWFAIRDVAAQDVHGGNP